MEDGNGKQSSITQTVVHGFQAPAVFTLFIVINAFFLGMLLLACVWLISEVGWLKREVRIMQVDVQDQNAILLREGIKKPGDDVHGPTSGDH